MTTDYIEKDILGHLLYALTPANRLVCKVALETGLRVGDILALRSADLKKGSFTITEQKTGKKRKIKLRDSLKKELQAQCGTIYIFPHRTDPQKHRTRQAVFNDLKRACKAFRLKGVIIAPHTFRKAYAVDLYRKTGDLKRVKNALNHSNDLVVLLYAMADELTKKRG